MDQPNMAAPRVVPEGRITAVLIVVVVTVCSIILPVACLMSGLTNHELSFSIVFTWNICWFSFSVAAICIFGYLVGKRRHAHVIQSVEIESNVPFLITTIVLGLVTCCYQIYCSTREFQCIRHELGLGFNLTKSLSTMFTGCLSLIQTGFIACVYRWQCRSSYSRMLLAIIISQNMFFCVNNILDVFRAEHTDDDITNVLHTFNNGSELDYFHNTLVFSTCNKTMEVTERVTKHVYKYVYSFQFVYSMFSLCFLLQIWNITLSIPEDANFTVSSREEEGYNETSPLLMTEDISPKQASTNVLTDLLSFVSRHSLKFTIVYVSIYFAFQLFVEIKSVHEGSEDVNNTFYGYEKASYYVHTIYTNIFCVVPFFGYLVSRKNNPSTWKFGIWNTMLILSACGNFILIIFESIASISVLNNDDEIHIGEKVIFLVDTLLHFVGTYSQILFIVKANDLVESLQWNRQQYLYVKGILVFLFLVNLEHSISDTFLTAPPLEYIQDMEEDDTYEHKHWWLITRIIFPIVIFYRIFSALMCLKVYKKTRNWNRI